MATVIAGLRATGPEVGGLLLAVLLVAVAVRWQRWWDARRARVQRRRRAERLAAFRARREAAAARSAAARAARPVRPVVPVGPVRARPAPVPVFATAAAAAVPVVESTLPRAGESEFPRAVDPALVGRPPLAAEPPVRPSRSLPSAADRRWSPAGGLAAALGGVVVVAGLVVALPGSPGPGALAGVAVLVLGWLGAVMVAVSVGQRRARAGRYRGLHAASVPLHSRGRCSDFLVIPEARR
ncbi:hypothetical protein [Micromonospora humidisoli]|uniref:Uncharacterized protein n=1 Tax=Micromonospora humidisoli TaxID=2807622 RepID=A0ABS2JAQ9_9ACTN|nr:hypothetical protein [Micromonospora humidisoli]MBM7083630.1 hypothetical protein [Micromonospora humidisoli]